MKLIACNSNRQLAEDISEALDIPLVNAEVKTFSDKETSIDIRESLRGEDVFIIQSTSCPANENLMELLIAIDAVKRSSAKRITAVIPYFGYARQDSQPGPRTPITAKLVANLLTTAGADRILTMDLHARQVQAFFDIPCDNLYAMKYFVRDVRSRFNVDNLVVISPDVGGVVRARAFAKKLGIDLAIIDKRREQANESKVMNIIGDVKDRHCLIIDDIVDTAGTLCNAAQALLDKGALSVHAYTSHGVLSGPAVERLSKADALSSLTITDSIFQNGISKLDKVRKVSIAPIFAKAIRRIHDENSVSALSD